MGNKASYIHLRGSDLRPQFHQFTAVVSHAGVPCPAWACLGSKSYSRCGCSLCVLSLSAQPHPNVKPMAYANTLLQLGMM